MNIFDRYINFTKRKGRTCVFSSSRLASSSSGRGRLVPCDVTVIAQRTLVTVIYVR